MKLPSPGFFPDADEIYANWSNTSLFGSLSPLQSRLCACGCDFIRRTIIRHTSRRLARRGRAQRVMNGHSLLLFLCSLIIILFFSFFSFFFFFFLYVWHGVGLAGNWNGCTSGDDNDDDDSCRSVYIEIESTLFFFFLLLVTPPAAWHQEKIPSTSNISALQTLQNFIIKKEGNKLYSFFNHKNVVRRQINFIQTKNRRLAKRPSMVLLDWIRTFLYPDHSTKKKYLKK
jgi:hypothetical protein